MTSELIIIGILPFVISLFDLAFGIFLFKRVSDDTIRSSSLVIGLTVFLAGSVQLTFSILNTFPTAVLLTVIGIGTVIHCVFAVSCWPNSD